MKYTKIMVFVAVTMLLLVACRSAEYCNCG